MVPEETFQLPVKDKRWCKWWTVFCSWSVHHPCKINGYITCEWLCGEKEKKNSAAEEVKRRTVMSRPAHESERLRVKKFNRHVHRWSDSWCGNRPSPWRRDVSSPCQKKKPKKGFRSEGLVASTSRPAEGRRGERKARQPSAPTFIHSQWAPRLHSFEVALFCWDVSGCTRDQEQEQIAKPPPDDLFNKPTDVV